jgi:hypothetical protein
VRGRGKGGAGGGGGAWRAGKEFVVKMPVFYLKNFPILFLKFQNFFPKYFPKKFQFL